MNKLSSRLSRPKLNSPVMREMQASCDSLLGLDAEVKRVGTRNVSPAIEKYGLNISPDPSDRDLKDIKLKAMLTKSAMGHKTPGFAGISPHR